MRADLIRRLVQAGDQLSESVEHLEGWTLPNGTEAVLELARLRAAWDDLVGLVQEAAPEAWPEFQNADFVESCNPHTEGGRRMNEERFAELKSEGEELIRPGESLVEAARRNAIDAAYAARDSGGTMHDVGREAADATIRVLGALGVKRVSR